MRGGESSETEQRSLTGQYGQRSSDILFYSLTPKNWQNVAETENCLMKHSLLMLGVGLLVACDGGVGEESVVEPGGDGTATVTELSQQASDAEQVDATPQADPLSGFDHYQLAEQYASGVGVLQNDEEALRHYRLSAELGDNSGLYALAEVYHKGDLVQRDMAEARRLWELVAENGGTWSMNAMVALLSCHEGRAQSHRGTRHLLYQGRVVEESDVKAYMWTVLALSRMDPQDNTDPWVSTRERLSRALTDDQRAEAERLAREWDAAHPR